MNQRLILIISTIALIIAGTALGILSYLQMNNNLVFSLVASFFAVLFVVFGLNLLIIKIILKK